MTATAQAIAAVADAWLRESPGRPLVLRAGPDGSVSASIGLDNSRTVTGQQAADILGVSWRTFSRADFYGLKRGADRRFSRASVERLRDHRAGTAPHF